jgi:hydrogenase maturation protein HypF
MAHAKPAWDSVEAMVPALVAGVRSGEPTACLARQFQASLAGMTARALLKAQKSVQPSAEPKLGLSGGVFGNQLLTGDILRLLHGQHRTALVHEIVPANDGGLCLGQALAGFLTATRLGSTNNMDKS